MNLFILLHKSNLDSLAIFELKQSNVRHILSITDLFARFLVFLKFNVILISASWLLVGWETVSSEVWYYFAKHDREQVTFVILLLRMNLLEVLK